MIKRHEARLTDVDQERNTCQPLGDADSHFGVVSTLSKLLAG